MNAAINPASAVAEADRLFLRRFEPGDVCALEPIFGDAEVMRLGPGAQNAEWTRAWVRRCLESYEQRGFGLWAVLEKGRRDLIGYCGLTWFPEIDGRPEVEIGYRLARAFWGHGYATEAAAAVRDYAFHQLRLVRLIALIAPRNIGSIRVAEKIGMRYEKDVMLEGYTYPDRLYVITRTGT